MADGDTGCIASLAERLGHAAPFSAEELAGIESLEVVHARDISMLEGCTGLRQLRLIACEIENLLVCESMTGLAELEIYASRVGSLVGAAFCNQLTRIDLVYTSLRDSSDLVGVATWNRGTIIGNPWDATSWQALRDVSGHRGMLIELSSEQDWTACCRLWERAEAVCGAAPGGGFLVRPGLPQLTSHRFDALQVGTPTVETELGDASFELRRMFTEYQSRVREPELAALAHARELGSAEAARGWIAAAGIAKSEQDALARFVERFPDVVFYRTTADALERTATTANVTAPAAYFATRAILDGVLPNHGLVPVRFDGFEIDSPRASRAAQARYVLGLRAHTSSEKALRDAGYVVIGQSTEQPHSGLLVHDGDAQIYEYNMEDLDDAVSNGQDVSSSIYAVFSSYAALLGHIVELFPANEAPIAAQ